MTKMFKYRCLIRLSLLTIFTLAHGIANTTQSYNSEQVQQFKKFQTCYATAVANEKWETGLDCAKKSLNLGRDIFSSGHKNIAALMHNYGVVLAKNKFYIESAEELRKVYTLYKKHYGKKSEAVGWLLIDLADAQVKYDAGKARKNYVKAIDILSLQESFDSLTKAKISLDASVHLSGAGGSSGGLKIALKMAEFAYGIFYENYGAKHNETSLAAFVIGKIYFLRKDYTVAEKYLKASLDNQNVGIYAHGILLDIYTKIGRDDLAVKHQKALGNFLPKQDTNSAYIPVFVETPKYPQRALKKGREGYAVVSLTITKTGGIRDPVLVEEYPEKMGFGKAAMKVAKKLKYAPQFKDGNAVEVQNVIYKYSFKMEK